MASFVGVSDKIYLAHLDLTGLTRQVDFGPLKIDFKECTTFADGGFQCFKPGLISGDASLNAYQDFAADVLDDEISAGQLGNQYALSVAPNPTGTLAVGDPAVITRGVLSELGMPFEKGEMATDMLKVAYDTAAARAKVGHLATAVTTSGSDSAIALAGPTSSQTLYSALHVIAYSGFTAVTVSIESDDNVNFTSATTRLTHTAVTAVGNEWKSAVGGWSSETHHRVRTTASGSGSVTYFLAFGIT